MAKKYSYIPHKIQSAPRKSSWLDITSYYRATFELMKPVIDEVLHFFRDELGSDFIFDQALIKEHLMEENSESMKSKAKESEFSRYYRNRMYNEILLYLVESENEDPLSIHTNIIIFLNEVLETFKELSLLIANDAEHSHQLVNMVDFLQERLFPDIKNFEKVFAQLKENQIYYEIHRYMLCSREEISIKPRSNEIPALSPHFIDIVKTITTKFNSEYLSFPTETVEIPVLEKKMLSEVFVSNIGTNEKNVFDDVAAIFGLEIESEELVKFSEEKMSILKKHEFMKEIFTDDGIKLEPRLSNETFFWIFLSNASVKRMNLSKKLINWISAVLSIIIFEAVLRKNMQEGNFFIRIFTDPYIEEKLIPYIMKLICFEPMLSIDYMQIEDSPVQRKKSLELLGDKIEAFDIIIDDLRDHLNSIAGGE